MPPEVETGRIPPHNLEAERSVLGAVLLENQALYTSIELLVPESFYQPGHRVVFSAMVAMAEKGSPIDLVTLSSRLEGEGRLEEAGGRVYLASLADAVPTAASAAHYCRIVHEKAILRGLIGTATDIVRDAMGGPDDAELLLDDAERRIFALSERKFRGGVVSVRDLVHPTFREIEDRCKRDHAISGVPTGYQKLDELTTGLQPADLVIVAGRPSMGKTAFVLNITQNASVRHQKSVLFFSLEMSNKQLLTRLLCAEARLDAQKVRSGRVGKADPGEWTRFIRAADVIKQAPIYIDDTAQTVLEMRAKSRRQKAEKGLDLVVVDYLQLMRGRGRADSREQEISEISRSLKALAKELAVPVIALSQLNRAVENRPGNRPILADLRESGAIEQDADVIMFIHRSEYFTREQTPVDEKGIAEIMVSKQRNGPTDTVRLAWKKEYGRFEDLADRTFAGDMS
jgi:replicative DNA helicase